MTVSDRNLDEDVPKCQVDENQNEIDKLRELTKESQLINAKLIGTDYNYKHTIVWKNLIFFVTLHILGLYGFWIFLCGGVGWKTVLWTYFMGVCGQEGVTIGAHRLYTHKSFKATPLLKAILIIFQTAAGQNSMFIWCRDHRLHHRYSDTDGDPHNAKRGFFFSHIGWLMHKKHPYVTELGMKIDMSDLEADWMVQFQKKYYYILYFILAVLIPASVPVIYFGETWWNALMFCYFSRYTILLNGTWLVNSAAHYYGMRPYDNLYLNLSKDGYTPTIGWSVFNFFLINNLTIHSSYTELFRNLQSVESWFVSFISWGEGWHNYHHAFPWDYKAAELGMHFNQSATIIEFCEKIGMAWNLKSASEDMVKNRILKTGDGTHYELGDEEVRRRVTAYGPVHPLNPTYNVIYEAPVPLLKPEGLPLYHEKDVFNVNVKQRKVANG